MSLSIAAERNTPRARNSRRNPAAAQGLTRGDLKVLREAGESIALRRGDVIYDLGARADTFYLIRSGAVKLIRSTIDGKEVTLGWLGDDEIFGEAVLAKGAYPERAIAASDAIVLAIGVAELNQIVSGRPAFGLTLARLIARRTLVLGERIQNLMYRSPRRRLACLLLELGRDFGSVVEVEASSDANGNGNGHSLTLINGKSAPKRGAIRRRGSRLKFSRPQPGDIELGVRITHQEMSSLLGVTRESISYAMGELEMEGLIRTIRRRIFLVDAVALGQIAR